MTNRMYKDTGESNIYNKMKQKNTVSGKGQSFTQFTNVIAKAKDFSSYDNNFITLSNKNIIPLKNCR